MIKIYILIICLICNCFAQDYNPCKDKRFLFLSKIELEMINQRGVLASAALIVSEYASNIEDVRSEVIDQQTTRVVFTLRVHSREHLAKIMRRLKKAKWVLALKRINQERGII